MSLNTAEQRQVAGNPTVQYVAPFVLFVLLLVGVPALRIPIQWEGPLRVGVLAIAGYICWPRDLSVRPVRPLASILIGCVVFLLWIGPDVLIPGYRKHWLFSNSLIGSTHSSIDPAALSDPSVLFWRTLRATLIVPIVEELFWRGWLMRWLIRSDFASVPLGAYKPLSFWFVALLFASEHGPYWDVALLTGVIYNAWMVRSRSMADCVLMHAVTNALLSIYVIATQQWQYWL